MAGQGKGKAKAAAAAAAKTGLRRSGAKPAPRAGAGGTPR